MDEDAKLLKWSGYLVATLLAALVLLFCFLSFFFPANIVARRVGTFVEGKSGEAFVVRDAHFSLLHGLVLEGVEVGTPPFLRVSRMALRYTLADLLQGRIRFTEVALIAPEVRLVAVDGRWNALRFLARLT
ncbi:MAG: hypothetical protein D6795_15130, partial [Deltaproteobacteria bacterium]